MDDFQSGLLLGFAFAVASTAIMALAQAEYWRTELVERGHAAYCPSDGKWAWIGECDP